MPSARLTFLSSSHTHTLLLQVREASSQSLSVEHPLLPHLFPLTAESNQNKHPSKEKKEVSSGLETVVSVSSTNVYTVEALLTISMELPALKASFYMQQHLRNQTDLINNSWACSHYQTCHDQKMLWLHFSRVNYSKPKIKMKTCFSDTIHVNLLPAIAMKKETCYWQASFLYHGMSSLPSKKGNRKNLMNRLGVSTLTPGLLANETLLQRILYQKLQGSIQW